MYRWKTNQRTSILCIKSSTTSSIPNSIIIPSLRPFISPRWCVLLYSHLSTRCICFLYNMPAPYSRSQGKYSPFKVHLSKRSFRWNPSLLVSFDTLFDTIQFLFFYYRYDLKTAHILDRDILKNVEDVSKKGQEQIYKKLTSGIEAHKRALQWVFIDIDEYQSVCFLSNFRGLRLEGEVSSISSSTVAQDRRVTRKGSPFLR